MCFVLFIIIIIIILYASEKEGEEKKKKKISYKCCDLHSFFFFVCVCQGCFYVLSYTSVSLFSNIIFLEVGFWPSSNEETNTRQQIGTEH